MEVLFIGGTGRSGTKITSQIMDKHSQILKLSGEPSFVVRPDGLLDLGYSLTDGWSFLSADKGIERFVKLMTDISNPYKSNLFLRVLNKKILPKFGISPMRYPGLHLDEDLGRSHILNVTRSFIKEISQGSYNGYCWDTPSFTIKPHIFSSKRLDRSYYRDSVDRFLRRLLSPIYNSERYWIDDTPHCFIFAEKLLELFPSAKIIHVYRDIRDVIASMRIRPWACRNIEGFCPWLKATLEKWFEVKERIPRDSFYEVRMERLIDEKEAVVNEICDFIHLPFQANMLDIDLSKGHVGRWKRNLSAQEVSFVNREFKLIMEHFGYE